MSFYRYGFTLIEMMVVVAILAILAALAAPSFNEAILNSKLAAYANSFAASARLARSEAIKSGTTVTLCRSASDTATACATSGEWQQGWMVVKVDPVDPTKNTVISRQQAFSSGYLLTSNVYSIDFQTIGVGATSATLKLCRATPTVGSQEREIKISVVGRVSVSTTKTGICA